MTMLAVFLSRSQTLSFLQAMRNAGGLAVAVNTPKEAGVGCGISAKFDSRFLPRAQAILSKKNYPSFAGFMKKTGMRFTFI